MRRPRRGRERGPLGFYLSIGALFLACSRGSEPPSIVLVVLDTFRADHLGAISGREGLTPRMDRLAAEGVLFDQCFTQYPLTLPSVSTLFTSQWPNVHGVEENYRHRLSADAKTLAEVLHGAGYRTAGFVSALPVRGETGCSQGFDVYDDDFSKPFVFHREQLAPLAEKWTGSERRGDETVARARAWLEKAKGPYFLFVHLFDAHSPYDAPPSFADRQPTPYAGEVAFVDHLVGELLDGTTPRNGEAAPIVAIVADHGEGLGEHEEWAHGMFLYDATLHVPWILSVPGRLEPRRVHDAVRLLDVAPTLVDLAGLAAPPEWAGQSCAALAHGGAEAARAVYAKNAFTRIEYGWSEERAWVTPEWKWIRVPRPELYDREKDPSELENVAAQHPEVASRLDAELTAFEASSRAEAAARGVGPLVSVIEPEDRVRAWLTNLGHVSVDHPSPLVGEAPDPKDRIADWNRTNESRTHVARGQAFLAAGDLALARAAFERAVSIKATPAANVGLGLTLNRLGDYEGARGRFERALEEAPNDLDALLGLAIVRDAKGDLRGADTLLVRATLVDSTSAGAWYHRASIRQRLGRLEDAASFYERVIRLVPAHAQAREALAAVDHALGRYDREAATWRALAGERDWDPVVHWRLGEACRLAGDDAGARVALERARALVGRGALADSIAASLGSIRAR